MRPLSSPRREVATVCGFPHEKRTNLPPRAAARRESVVQPASFLFGGILVQGVKNQFDPDEGHP